MLAATVWRDYVTDGVPASGVHDPLKSDIRTWGADIETAITTLQAGGAVGTANIADGAVTLVKLNADVTAHLPTISLTNANISVGSTARPTPAVDLLAPLYYGTGTIAIGHNVLKSAANTATLSVFVGQQSGEDANDVYACAAFGLRTFSKANTMSYGTAIGIDCMTNVTGGDMTTGLGAHAGTYKTNCQTSVVLGAYAAFAGGTMSGSVVIGYLAGAGTLDASIFTYNDVVIIGDSAARYNKGARQVIIGNGACNTSTITGGYNVIGGGAAAQTLTSGTNNSGWGDAVLNNLTTGSFNAALGYAAGPSTGTFSNTVSLGSQASSTASNQVTLGNASIATLRCQVTTITALSDANYKDNIIDLPIGLEFIRAVKVRRFAWNERAGSRAGDVEAGVIAQELQTLQKRFGAEWMQLVYDVDPERLEATPGKLLFPLIRAVQELADHQETWMQAANDNVLSTIKSMNDEVISLSARINGVDEKIADLQKQIDDLKRAA